MLGKLVEELQNQEEPRPEGSHPLSQPQAQEGETLSDGKGLFKKM